MKNAKGGWGMHEKQAKAILSAQNGMNIYRGVPMAASTAMPEVPATRCSMNLKTLR